MKNTFLIRILLISFILTIATTSHALNIPTHKLINTYIAQSALDGFSLDSYLKGQLGFQSGRDNKFNNKEAWAWIRDGGEFEDEPMYLRSVNHFHNPLTKQGFTDLNHWWTLWGLCGLLNGQSSIQWSQSPPNTQWPGGHYSWHDARDYFYNALTSTDQATRDQNFADTFRGVGQLMHLVEDLSVPEHTRNTFHGLPFTYGYENWAEDNIKSNNIVNYPPIYFDPSIIGNTNPLAAVPVANLFDTNQYVGPDPDPNVTLRNNIGLSEYTNANFLCPGTMFTTDFPYPNWGSVIQNPDPDPITGRLYITKLGMNETGGNGEHIDHLAVSRWGYNRLPSSIRQSGISLKMDDQVYSDYAQKLIPRAVGYAAGLLNYFFRGRIAVVDAQWTATSVKFKIRNDTPNEVIGPGTLIVSYEYSNSYGVSNVVQLNETIAAGSESSNEYTLTFSQSIPSGANTKYWLVFRGKLGNEDDAVVAKVEAGSKSGTIGCLTTTCDPGACPTDFFVVPPITDGGGSFTVDITSVYWLSFLNKVVCSYGSGYMSCDVTLWFQQADWNNGKAENCQISHCEGPWDGFSFYAGCTLVWDGYHCYQCSPDYLIWLRISTQ